MSAADKIVAQLKTLRALMDKQDKLEAQLQPIKAQIKQLEEVMLNDFSGAELDSTSGSGLRATRKKSFVPNVTDVLVLNAFRAKKANWDLIPGSVPVQAWRERMDSKLVVPGTESFNRISLSVTRTDRKKEV